MKKILSLIAIISNIAFSAEIDLSKQDEFRVTTDSVQADSEIKILRKMLVNTVLTCLEQYHNDDWLAIKTEVGSSWFDPSFSIEKKVQERVQKFNVLLQRTFNNHNESVKRILELYFDYQLECLELDYKLNGWAKGYLWSTEPAQIYAILAFEKVATDMQILIDHYYHRISKISNKQTQLIEFEQSKLSAITIENSVSEDPQVFSPPPPPPPLLPTSKPRTVISSAEIIKIKGSIGESKTAIKITLNGTSSLSSDVLDEIKKGTIRLKPASERILRLKPELLDDSPAAILLRYFGRIRGFMEEDSPQPN